MNKTNKQQVPKIRFDGFRGDWRTSNLKSITQIKSGTTPSRRNPEYYFNGTINWLRTTDLNNSILYESIEKVTKLALEQTSLHIYPEETIYLAMYGGFNQIGRVVLMKSQSTCNQALSALLPQKNINQDFLLQFLIKNTNSWKHLAASSRKDPNITKSDVEEFIVVTPELHEQTQIGNFFQQLDKLIDLQSRAVESAETYKKAMLQKMFPQKGEKVPRVRFEGFSGDWIEKSLHKVATIIGGGTPDTKVSEYWNGDIHWFAPAEIGKQIYAENSIRKITKLGLQKSSAKILPAMKTILFTSRAGIGDMAILKIEACTNQGFQSLVVKDEFDVYFIYSMGSFIKQQALKIASGSTFLEISGKALGSLVQRYPSIEEQTQIGNFFQKLDQNIESEKKKLEQYQTMKRAMLLRMFV